MLVCMLVALVGAVVIYQRALVPMALSQINRQVENGQMPPEAAAQAERAMSGPVMMTFQIAVQPIGVALATLVFALVPWIAAGFMLGQRFRYRDAFVVTAWTGLVSVPATILTYGLAWANETMATVHTGFGVLLPAEDPPSKLTVGLGLFLDHGIGPLAIWYLVVLALGTAALSGAPLRRVAMALGGLWLVVWVIISVVAMLFTPGA
jgi:hypothetical protein